MIVFVGSFYANKIGAFSLLATVVASVTAELRYPSSPPADLDGS
jgi:hypothetical protein